MNIGFLGLGKLGLPCALALDARNHTVFGYDINSDVKRILETKKLPYREEGADDLLKNHNIMILILKAFNDLILLSWHFHTLI